MAPSSPSSHLLLFPQSPLAKLTHLDLSMAVYQGPDLVAGVLERTRCLVALSLEHGQLNARGCLGIAQNTDLEVLNLVLCRGMDLEGVEAIVEGCRK